MALIRQSNTAQVAQGAIVLDLGDLQRHGELMIERARKQATGILEEANAERSRLMSGAAEEGRKAGFERGLIEGREAGSVEGRAGALAEHGAALAALEKGWSEALGLFCAQRDKLFTEARTDVLRLAALIAEKVVKRKVDLDEGIVADQLESVLGIIARPTELVVSIHPADRTVAERAVPGLAGRSSLVRHVEFVEDAALERGSCVARTRGSVPGDGGAGGGGEIDASITTQVQRVIEALLPGGPAKPGATAPPRVGAEGGA